MANRGIPVINNLPEFQQWRNALKDSSTSVPTPKAPWNLTVSSQQGGNYVTWQVVTGADGYILNVSTDGNFNPNNPNLTSIRLPGGQNISRFDSTPTAQGATPAKRYYQVAATAGTTNNPQSVVGPFTTVVSQTAIPPNNVVTASTTNRDLGTTDKIQSSAGRVGGSYYYGNHAIKG